MKIKIKRMKKLVLILLLLSSINIQAQERPVIFSKGMYIDHYYDTTNIPIAYYVKYGNSLHIKKDDTLTVALVILDMGTVRSFRNQNPKDSAYWYVGGAVSKEKFQISPYQSDITAIFGYVTTAWIDNKWAVLYMDYLYRPLNKDYIVIDAYRLE